MDNRERALRELLKEWRGRERFAGCEGEASVYPALANELESVLGEARAAIEGEPTLEEEREKLLDAYYQDQGVTPEGPRNRGDAQGSSQSKTRQEEKLGKKESPGSSRGEGET